jgi:hypothetical protein
MTRAFRNNSGQSMLFMVMSLSSIIVMVASLSSLIMTFELRQTTDSRATGQAIMAADTGVECAIYKEFYDITSEVCSDKMLVDGASFNYTRTGEDSVEGRKIITWVTAGEDAQGRAVRALQIKFVEQR